MMIEDNMMVEEKQKPATSDADKAVALQAQTVKSNITPNEPMIIKTSTLAKKQNVAGANLNQSRVQRYQKRSTTPLN